jgi:hypothetical protein
MVRYSALDRTFAALSDCGSGPVDDRVRRVAVLGSLGTAVYRKGSRPSADDR